jgi:hypothetical protein
VTASDWEYLKGFLLGVWDGYVILLGFFDGLFEGVFLGF